MNYWLFIVTNRKENSKNYSAKEIFNKRMEDKFWGLGEKTPNRKNLKNGDKVIFYIAYPETVFGGEASLKNSSRKLSDDESKKYSHGKKIFLTQYGVELDEIKIWENPISVRDQVSKLSFIENKEYWFTYFQGGVRQISESDYKNILSGRTTTIIEDIEKEKDLESVSDFALESHLEEFIYENWESINWGHPIILYKTEEQNGRQFPAGLWSIDFLAVNKETNDLVVIELKRGKTSDSTVGQILRYINWVKENISEKGQKVKGIIIAKEVDESLKYSVKGMNFIEVRTYQVNFSLKKEKL